MLVLATLENWYITGLDIYSAYYLYGKLNEEIYMEQLEGFAVPGQECKVLCLWRALYGVKQAGLAWWHTLDESLKELRFECLKYKAGIFFYKKKGTNVVIGIIYPEQSAIYLSLSNLDIYILPSIQWWIQCGTYCMHQLRLGIRPYLLPLTDRFLPEACRWLDQLDFLSTEDYCILVHRS